MFWTWKVVYGSRGWCAPFEDAPDAAGSGGGADLRDTGDGSPPSDAVVADDGGTTEGVAAVDETEREEALEDLLIADDEDEDQRSRPDGERIKALAKKNRKLRKQVAKLLPLSKRLEGVDLDDLVLSKRQYVALAEQIRTNPRLRALIHGSDADDEPVKGRRTPPADVDEQFDESSLPFNPNESPTNRYFANLAKENFDTRKLLRQVQERLDGTEGRERAKTESQIRTEWKTTITSAAAHIKDEGVQTVFKDLLAAAYKDPDVRAKGYTVQQLVSHYLKVLKVNPADAAKATAAAAKPTPAPAIKTAATQQRIAEQNKSLPRTVAPAGSPAPARNERPTLQGLRKQITGASR